MTDSEDRIQLLDALEDRDRETVRRWSAQLGLGDRWDACPPLRSVVECLALLEVADRLADVENLSPRAAWLAAAELLLEDDSETDTHPGDVIARRLRRWLRAARTKCPSTVSADRV